MLGIHTNMPATSRTNREGAPVRQPAAGGLSADEQHAWDQLDSFYKHGLGYARRWRTARRRSTRSRILPSAWPRGCSTTTTQLALIARVFDGQTGGPDAGRHPRQRHALLADEHGGLVGSPVLGQQSRLLRPEGRHDPGRGERVPGRDLRGSAELGREGLSQADPLQQAPQGRALRRLGTAGALLATTCGRRSGRCAEWALPEDITPPIPAPSQGRGPLGQRGGPEARIGDEEGRAGAPHSDSLKQVDAGDLNVGYADAGPAAARRSCCCTAGPTTSTATPRSRRCSRRRAIG